ncbi:LTA synthase family protein [Capnocytophaga cynodegmi]|uniref:LTA synthase family protein n=1 Tax=Capnocytophaga cynodegmi TaxID=28189 RepID=UPI00385C0094
MLKQLFKIHLLSLFIFFVFRLLLLFSNGEHWQGFSSELFHSFVMGLRFDTVINGYILVLPTLVWMILYVLGINSHRVQKILYWYCAVIFTFAYTISAFDIPYFNHFFSRLDLNAFQWIENPTFIMGMVFKDFRLWGYVLPFIGLLFVFHYLLIKIFKQNVFPGTKKFPLGIRAFISLLIMGGTFLGIRGRLEAKSPIRVGTAYFSTNAFFNKMGLNPNFTLLDAFLQKRDSWTDFMPNEKAIQQVLHDLEIPNDPQLASLEHKIFPDSLNLGKPNIVLVLMESMSSQYLEHFGNKQKLTPVLNDLVSKSIFFENAYSAGIHTHNGIFSTLYSYPAIWANHAMKQMQEFSTNSIKTLTENGYTTVYFTTHDGQFDNVEGFLLANHFDKIYTQRDYPSSEVRSNLGVPDDYLFAFGLEKMNHLYQTGKPFFCTLMTASNHAPIIIPEYFKPSQKELTNQAIEYSDWAIGQFLNEAKKQPWFQNTLFVFIGDHGSSVDTTYEMSLSYHTVPLIFYAPYLLKRSEIKSDFVQQIDVLPSILGLTDISYSKQNMGINIWRQKRPFAYFSANDKIGVINDQFYYIYKKDGSEALYKYKTKDTHNYIDSYRKLADEMKKYMSAHLQTSYNEMYSKKKK